MYGGKSSASKGKGSGAACIGVAGSWREPDTAETGEWRAQDDASKVHQVETEAYLQILVSKGMDWVGGGVRVGREVQTKSNNNAAQAAAK